MPVRALSRGHRIAVGADTAPGLVRLGGSVGEGGRNAAGDTSAVQNALNAVLPPMGGPLSALVVDGLCGPLTKAAIKGFQQRWTSFHDGRIDPGGKTLAALNGSVGAIAVATPTPANDEIKARAPGVAASTVGATPGQRSQWARQHAEMMRVLSIVEAQWRQVEVTHHHAPKAYQCTLAALRNVTAAGRHAARLGAMLAPGGPAAVRDDPDRLAFLQLAKHFKLDEKHPAKAVAAVAQVERILRRMAIVQVPRVRNDGEGTLMTPSGTTLYVCLAVRPLDPDTRNAYGYTTLAGAWSNAHIFLPPTFDTAGPRLKTMIVLHELAHFSGPPGGAGIDDLGYSFQDRFRRNNSWQRLHNAEAYMAYAFECGEGTDAMVNGLMSDGMDLPHMDRLNLYSPPVNKGGGFGTLMKPAIGNKDPYAFPASYPISML